MEEYKLEKQSFYALFGNTRDASPVDDLMQHNKSAWTGYCEEAKDSQPYQAIFLSRKTAQSISAFPRLCGRRQ